MSLTLVALEIDAVDPQRLTTFWAALLAREPTSSGCRLPGVGTGADPGADFELRFVVTDTPKVGLHRMHADLTSTAADDQERSVDLAIRLGGSHLDVGQRGDEGHVVLCDPEGNEFCVIEPGNAFLADTARIGAMAGDGMAEVGHFWADVLGWPLVWDQDEETAVQHPLGGTKITWGGPPVRAKTARNRLRWVLATDQPLAAEIDRLVALGATVIGADAERAELADPEGNEFHLERALTAVHGR